LHLRLAGGASLIFDGLRARHDCPSAVRSLLATLAAVCQDAGLREQLVQPSEPQEAVTVLNAILRAAQASHAEDLDIVAQACCALSSLTNAESQSRAGLRALIDRDQICQMLVRAQEAFPESDLQREYCEHLIACAATSDLQSERLLSPHGTEISGLRQRASAPGASQATGRVMQSLTRRRAHMDNFDIYRSLRPLGVGASLPEPAEEMPPEAAEPEGVILGGIFDGLIGQPAAPEPTEPAPPTRRTSFI